MATYKTPFSKRCEILGNVWLFYAEDAKRDEVWSKYFEIYDVGLPLAYMINMDFATIKKGKEYLINDAWDDICKVISVDPMAKYDDLQSFFATSPNDPLDIED